MTLLETGMYSNTLCRMSRMNILLPGGAFSREGMKVLYLLHGYGDDHTSWVRRTSLERVCEKYNVAVVMPEAGQSFYANSSMGRYYDYIAHELPATVEHMFALPDRSENRFIAGLSMGGYGAVKIALRECGRFKAAASLSGCLDIRGDELGDLIIRTMDGEIPENEDLFSLSEKAVGRDDRPDIFIGVGYSDFLYRQSKAFKEHLESIGYPHTYKESEGDHSWRFWDEYIVYVLDWMLTNNKNN